MLPEAEDFCRLLLFRHPELTPADAVRAIGRGDAAVGRRGQQRIVAWLGQLAPVRVGQVWSGPQRHCADAAAAIGAAKGVEPAVDDRLSDQSLGEWEGREWDDITRTDGERLREFFQDYGEARAPGGESLGEAIERMLEWWTDHRAGLVGATVAVVAPGGLISGFAAAMLGMRLSRAICLQLPPGGVGVVDVYANGVRIAAWNPAGWPEAGGSGV